MKYFVSVGFQAGRINPDGKLYVIHNDKLFGLPYVAYRMWRIFQNVSSYEQAVNQLGMSGDQFPAFTEHSFSELRDAGLIVPLRESLYAVPYRMGTGSGYDDSSESYIIDCGGKVRMSFLPYMVWCHADGKKHTREIMASLAEHKVVFQEKEFFRALFSLLRTDAMILS